MSYDLVISDCHVGPDQDLSRFSALGRMIKHEQPDNIICVGDFGTLDSCSYHEEDRFLPNLEDDRVSIRVALKLMFEELHWLQGHQRRCKVKQYKPGTYLLKGNHEERLVRRMEDDPNRLGSVIGSIDWHLGFSTYFSTIKSYGEYLTINGIDYTHAPFNKLNRPITGINRGRKLALESARNIIYGHTHTGDFTVAPLIKDNESRCSLNLPAFMDEDNMEPYAEKSQSGWTYGLCRIYPSHIPNKPFTYDWMSTKRLMETYG